MLSQLTPSILRAGSTRTLEKFLHATHAIISYVEKYGDEFGEFGVLEEQREMARRLETELRRRDPAWNQYRSTN